MRTYRSPVCCNRPDGGRDYLTKAVAQRVENESATSYSHMMDDTVHRAEPPTAWLEALAESDADLAAGRIVSGDVVMRDLRDALARLEAKVAAKRARKTVAGG